MRLPFPLSSFQLFLLCFLISFLFNYQTIFIQDRLTPGDTGGNLYTIEAVLHGQVPFKDFWWNYGPLPLYYNALFFKLFGSQIQSAIWARIILKSVFAGVFLLAARRIMPSMAALLATVFFCAFMPEFQHNYSHYAGVCMEIGVLWAVLSYYQTAQEKYVWGAWFYVILLGLTKINFGLLFLLGTFLSFILCDIFHHKKRSFQKIIRHVGAFMTVFLIFGFIYYLFIRTLSIHQMKQCFPVFKGYNYCGDGCKAYDGFVNLFETTLQTIQHSAIDALIAGLAFIASLRLIVQMFIEKSWVLARTNRNPFLISCILLILILCGFHEFIKGGADYQLFWAKPLTVIFLSYLISEACLISGSIIQGMTAMIVVVMIIIRVGQHWTFLESFKKDKQFFKYKHMNIYVTEAPKDIKSMVDTANYIDKNIPPDETFYTFPHSALYYYLTDRRMPDWLFCFYKAINVIPQQQMDLIQNLDRQRVNYIVQSSVCYCGSGAWGKFGSDYGVLFDKYIKKHYREVARFGEWDKDDPTHYIGGMGTRIFKRN